LLNNPEAVKLFPKDAVERARQLLDAFKGGVGAYQDSRGNPLVRQQVADFITARDGFKANPNVSMGFQIGKACSPELSQSKCL
jgi:aspartate/methionine/tyrosine aminotransferase